MTIGPHGAFNIQTGTTYWFNSLSAAEGTIFVMTTPHSICWYQDGKAQYASWSNPPEAIVRQAVELAHRQQWDELAVLVKLMQAL